MIKYFTKDGRKFVVSFEMDRTVFIGTAGLLSDIAAQKICHEQMVPLRWKATRTFRSLPCDDYICTGIGFKVPIFVNAEKAINKLF